MVPLTPVTPSLTGMPLELLIRIIKYTEWPSYSALRKTCQILRNHMIVDKPAVYTERIRFTVTENGIEFIFRAGYLLIWNSRDTNLDQFFNNIAILLGHVKNVVDSFEVRLYLGAGESLNANLLEFLRVFLSTKEPRLEIGFFGTNDLNQMTPVLANLGDRRINIIRMEIPKPKVEEPEEEPVQPSRPATRSTTRGQADHRFLSLENPGNGNRQPIQPLPQIAKREDPFLVISDNVKATASWRTATRLFVMDIWLQNNISDCFHFLAITVLFETLTTAQLIQVKEMFARDLKKQHFLIYYETFQDQERWIEMFGEGRRQDRGYPEWFFETASMQKVVKIRIESDMIHIDNYEKFGLPENAMIQN